MKDEKALHCEHCNAQMIVDASGTAYECPNKNIGCRAGVKAPRQLLADIAMRITEYFLEGETKTRIAHHAKAIEALLREALSPKEKPVDE